MVIYGVDASAVLPYFDGEEGAKEALIRLTEIGFELVPTSSDHAVHGAILKNELKIPYVDVIGAALAQDFSHSVLVTADFDFKAAEHLISIEFLPQKPVAPHKQ
jgi:predicted nucleic acid-binding protein